MCLLHIKHHIQICDDDRFVVKAGLVAKGKHGERKEAGRSATTWALMYL